MISIQGEKGILGESNGYRKREEVKTDLDDKTVTLGAPGHDMRESVVF